MVVIDPIPENGQLIGFVKITRDMTEQRCLPWRRWCRASANSHRLVQGVTDYAIYMLDPAGLRPPSSIPAPSRPRATGRRDRRQALLTVLHARGDLARVVPLVKALETAASRGPLPRRRLAQQRKDGMPLGEKVVIDAIRDDEGRAGRLRQDHARSHRASRGAGRARNRANRLFFQSQKMEAVGQLTGGLAHDFNNLLTGITGSLELLKSRASRRGASTRSTRYVAAAQGAASRASALTHRLLAFARRQTLEPKATDPRNKLVAEIAELIRRHDRSRDHAARRSSPSASGRRCAIPTSSRTPSSTSASMRATPCRTAGG